MGNSPPRFFAVVVFLLVVLPCVAQGATFTVRQDGTGDFTTISAAVAAASPGDDIDVGPGTYNESIEVDKTLTIVGTSGPAATILDGMNAFTPVRMWGPAAVHMEGLTIAHGLQPTGTAGGGVGIREGAVVTITGCHFEENSSSLAGGAVFVSGPSRADIDNCSFTGNHADGDGAAGYVTEGGVMNVIDCTFVENTANPWSAALSSYYAMLNVSGCLFAHNESSTVAGAIYYYRSDGYVTRSTFYNNTSGDDFYSATVVINRSSSTSVTECIFCGDQTSYGLYYILQPGYHECNLFWNNARGPIAGDVLAPTEVVADPLFCSPAADNFYVALDSPAPPQNNTCGVLIGAYPVGCGPVPVRNTTWGRIKDAYRKDD